MNPVIYRIEFPDGQFYIGSTVNFSARRTTHLRHSRKQKAVNPKLQAAFDAHPICGIYVVASGFDRETLHLLEQQIIEQDNPPLNIYRKPTKLPPRYSGRSKPFGPHACIRDAAEALGVTYIAAKKAAQRMSYEEYVARLEKPKQPEMVGPPNPTRNSRLVLLDDAWVWRREVAAVSSKTYEHRRRRGWSVKDALTTPVGEQRPGTVRRPSAAKVCARYGVPDYVYYARRHMGWSIMEALGLKQRPPARRPKVKKRIISAGGQSMTVNAWAKRLGVAPSVIHSRLAIGWSEAEAVGVERRLVDIQREQRKKEAEARKRPREVFTYQGVTGTLSELCRHFNVSYPRAYARKKGGWPVETWFRDDSQRVWAQQCSWGEFCDRLVAGAEAAAASRKPQDVQTS